MKQRRGRPAGRGPCDAIPYTVSASVLTEDEVIDVMRDYLAGRSWWIIARATAIQRGDDLVAERGAERLVIEAKGAGSSKEGRHRQAREDFQQGPGVRSRQEGCAQRLACRSGDLEL